MSPPRRLCIQPFCRQHKQCFSLEAGDTAQIPSKHLPLLFAARVLLGLVLYEPGKAYSVLRDLLVSKTDKKWLEKKWREFLLHGEPGSKRGNTAPGWGWKPHSRVSLRYPVSRKLPPLRGHPTAQQIRHLGGRRRGIWRAVMRNRQKNTPPKMCKTLKNWWRLVGPAFPVYSSCSAQPRWCSDLGLRHSVIQSRWSSVVSLAPDTQLLKSNRLEEIFFLFALNHSLTQIRSFYCWRQCFMHYCIITQRYIFLHLKKDLFIYRSFIDLFSHKGLERGVTRTTNEICSGRIFLCLVFLNAFESISS